MKRTKISRRGVLGAAALALPASMLKGTGVAWAQSPIVLRVSHDEPTFMITHGVLTELAESVQKKSNGAVKIEVFPGAQLAGGNLRTQFQQNQAGAIDVAITATSILNNWTTKADVISLPFLLSNLDSTKKLVSSDLGRDIMAVVEPLGLHAIDLWARDLRQWVNAKRPIETPADMKGMRFRVPETALWVATFRALGATPTPMPFGEAFTAVQLGTLDGAERPTEFITGEKWHTIAKYLTISDYTGDALMPTFNKAKWDGLPKDVKDLLEAEFRAAGEKKYEREKAMKADVQEAMRKSGMQVNVLTAEQREAFKREVAPVWKEWAGKLPANWTERAQKIVG
jgi:tripartite ATP-independent transporter DctP family solute receptor